MSERENSNLNHLKEELVVSGIIATASAVISLGIVIESLRQTIEDGLADGPLELSALGVVFAELTRFTVRRMDGRKALLSELRQRETVS